MPQPLIESTRVFLKRVAEERRGETALGLVAAALGLIILIWVSLLAVAESPPKNPRRAPAAGLKPEIYANIRAVLDERRRGLEKVFEREYPDPFAPRQAAPENSPTQ